MGYEEECRKYITKEENVRLVEKRFTRKFVRYNSKKVSSIRKKVTEEWKIITMHGEKIKTLGNIPRPQ